MYNFRNDYSQGAHPRVLEALAATNLEGNPGYGDDPYCARAAALIKGLCNAPQADVQFLIGGTQTNFTAICAFLRPWEGVICAVTGHVNDHEGGAVESTGHKLICMPTQRDGKLTPALVRQAVKDFENPHVVHPGLVYISDATENGAVYTLAELEALSAVCKENGLLLFLDGARLGAAIVSTASDLTLADLARLTDAFYIGGTKNGALMGEALVIVNPALQEGFFRIKKQRGAVLAKGWLLGVQFEELFRNGLYFDMARHANAMAARLQDGFRALGLPLYVNSTTNQVFPVVYDELKEKLSKIAIFEDWCPSGKPGTSVIRFVTNFSTAQEDVDGLLAELKKLL